MTPIYNKDTTHKESEKKREVITDDTTTRTKTTKPNVRYVSTQYKWVKWSLVNSPNTSRDSMKRKMKRLRGRFEEGDCLENHC